LKNQKLSAVFDGMFLLPEYSREIVEQALQLVLLVIDAQHGIVFSDGHNLPKRDGQIIGGDLSGHHAQKHLAQDQKDLKFAERNSVVIASLRQ
jgi:hypothetical protein